MITIAIHYHHFGVQYYCMRNMISAYYGSCTESTADTQLIPWSITWHSKFELIKQSPRVFVTQSSSNTNNSLRPWWHHQMQRCWSQSKILKKISTDSLHKLMVKWELCSRWRAFSQWHQKEAQTLVLYPPLHHIKGWKLMHHFQGCLLFLKGCRIVWHRCQHYCQLPIGYLKDDAIITGSLKTQLHHAILIWIAIIQYRIHIGTNSFNQQRAYLEGDQYLQPPNQVIKSLPEKIHIARVVRYGQHNLGCWN